GAPVAADGGIGDVKISETVAAKMGKSERERLKKESDGRNSYTPTVNAAASDTRDEDSKHRISSANKSVSDEEEALGGEEHQKDMSPAKLESASRISPDSTPGGSEQGGKTISDIFSSGSFTLGSKALTVGENSPGRGDSRPEKESASAPATVENDRFKIMARPKSAAANAEERAKRKEAEMQRRAEVEESLRQAAAEKAAAEREAEAERKAEAEKAKKEAEEREKYRKQIEQQLIDAEKHFQDIIETAKREVAEEEAEAEREAAAEKAKKEAEELAANTSADKDISGHDSKSERPTSSRSRSDSAGSDSSDESVKEGRKAIEPRRPTVPKKAAAEDKDSAPSGAISGRAESTSELDEETEKLIDDDLIDPQSTLNEGLRFVTESMQRGCDREFERRKLQVDTALNEFKEKEKYKEQIDQQFSDEEKRINDLSEKVQREAEERAKKQAEAAAAEKEAENKGWGFDESLDAFLGFVTNCQHVVIGSINAALESVNKNASDVSKYMTESLSSIWTGDKEHKEQDSVETGKPTVLYPQKESEEAKSIGEESPSQESEEKGYYEVFAGFLYENISLEGNYISETLKSVGKTAAKASKYTQETAKSAYEKTYTTLSDIGSLFTGTSGEEKAPGEERRR
ncbi:hypothetical protein N9W34_06420, partial [Rickettsiales bacterium]|nr:hypothetical protein [Rickettsiales bacterium]